MPLFEIRPFQRADRDQLADLVNAHASAVVPGMGTSVASLLASLERDPAEAITDPWVTQRVTLVAEQQRRVVAAAHLLRYGDQAPTGESYFGLGQVEWLVFWPEAPAGNPHWADATAVAETSWLLASLGWKSGGPPASVPKVTCPFLVASTACPSNGPMSGNCTSGPASRTRGTARSFTSLVSWTYLALGPPQVTAWKCAARSV